MGAVPLNAYTAVIDATAGCAPGDPGAPAALASIAGVPLLSRALEACQAAGIRKVLVTVAGSSLDEARRLGRRLAPRLLVEVIPATSPDPWLAVRNGLNRAALVLPGDVLVEAALLKRLQSGPLPEGGAVLAVLRGEEAFALPCEADGVCVRGDRVTALGLPAAASNGRATGVWIASAGFLDEVAAARLDGRPEPVSTALQQATVAGRVGWVAAGPEPAPLRVPAAGPAHSTEQRLLARLAEAEGGKGLVERATREVLRRVVLPLGLSRWTVAVAGGGLALTGILLVILAGWTRELGDWARVLAWPGALLVLLGVLVTLAERRLAALHGRFPAGGAWGEALRDDVLGLAFFASLGANLSLAATSVDDVVAGGGLSRASNVYLVLALLFVVLVAYARYVVYFDVVRRLGGVDARARFAWWFAEQPSGSRSWRRVAVRLMRRARWTTLVGLGALAVLAGLLQVAFLAAVGGAVLTFALALLHQIQRGDL